MAPAPSMSKPSFTQRLAGLMGSAFSSKKSGDTAAGKTNATAKQKLNRRLSTAQEDVKKAAARAADTSVTEARGNNEFLRFHATSSAGYEPDNIRKVVLCLRRTAIGRR